MNAPRTLVGELRGMGEIGIRSPSGLQAYSVDVGVSREKKGLLLVFGGDQCSEK